MNLWKRNEIHFFSKGQKKKNVRSQKKRNVDIPTRDFWPLLLNIIFHYVIKEQKGNRLKQKHFYHHFCSVSLIKKRR